MDLVVPKLKLVVIDHWYTCQSIENEFNRNSKKPCLNYRKIVLSNETKEVELKNVVSTLRLQILKLTL